VLLLFAIVMRWLAILAPALLIAIGYYGKFLPFFFPPALSPENDTLTAVPIATSSLALRRAWTEPEASPALLPVASIAIGLAGIVAMAGAMFIHARTRETRR